MKKIKKRIIMTDLGINIQTIREAVPEHALFFDLETTGLSPARAKIYLVGAVYLTDTELVTEQFFAEDPSEEAVILRECMDLFQRFDTLITFYGNSFDLPFLKGRLEILGSAPVYDNKTYVDLYQSFRKYKHILCLEDMKQKTLESAMGIQRVDRYSGKELIRIYKAYMASPTDDLEETMLRHNYEDLLGMVRLSQAKYALDRFFSGDFQPVDQECVKYRKADGTKGQEFLITCALTLALPAVLSCNNGCFFLHGTKTCAALRIPLYEGTLKYFYPDYKAYYYLPKEDMAIHKSVAAFVDKQHRERARAENCYTKKTGTFLPQSGELFVPAFYVSYKEPVSYFEPHFELPDGSIDTELLKKYCLHMLETLRSGK